jgi:hypothetical protein
MKEIEECQKFLQNHPLKTVLPDSETMLMGISWLKGVDDFDVHHHMKHLDKQHFNEGEDVWKEVRSALSLFCCCSIVVLLMFPHNLTIIVQLTSIHCSIQRYRVRCATEFTSSSVASCAL